MGIEVAAMALFAVSEVAKAGTEVKAASAKEQALGLEASEMELKNQQKTISNYDVIQKTLDAQEAQQTIKGTAFSSPSFNAIQRETLNKGATLQSNTEIEGDVEQANIAIEKQNVQSSLYAALFGDVANVSKSVFDINSKTPKTEDL